MQIILLVLVKLCTMDSPKMAVWAEICRNFISCMMFSIFMCICWLL